MSIKNISIKNFRGIQELEDPINLSNFNIFIGDNGTSKTAILEAINFCLSPSYVSNRLSISDFYNGGDQNIEIEVEFHNKFIAKPIDGYGTQDVECNKVRLEAKKRDKASPGKVLSDLVIVTHYVVPVADKGEKGWEQPRKTSKNSFKFTERHLAFSTIEVDIPRVFYFGKTRNRQLSRGFNSSLSNIVDDLNWRFDKAQRDKKDDEHFKHKRNEIHNLILSETGGDTIKKTIDEANNILKEIGVEKIDISLLKTLTPYDNSELVHSFDGFELPVSLSGSGIEMAIAVALLEALAKISKEKMVLIIDEPELHLHPKLQERLFKHMNDISNNIQIIVSTHSPFLFKNAYQFKDISLLISKKCDKQIVVQNAKEAGFGLLKWSPSWGEICYFAYELPTIEFHDDLYAALQDRERKERVSEIEAWFITKGIKQDTQWQDKNNAQHSETLMTYIRNRIHHGNNQDRPMYTPEQLKKSIVEMINLLQSS